MEVPPQFSALPNLCPPFAVLKKLVGGPAQTLARTCAERTANQPTWPCGGRKAVRESVTRLKGLRLRASVSLRLCVKTQRGKYDADAAARSGSACACDQLTPGNVNS